MIKIEINGVDPYLVLGYSKDHTTNLANLFEVSEEDLIFVAHDDLPIYKGVDQTSWNAVVHVFLQEKYEPVEKLVAKYLLNTLNELSVHVNLDFIYLHSHAEYVYVNDAYPRFLDEKHAQEMDDEREEIEIFEGNIFEGHEDELDRIYDEHHKGDN